MRTRTFFLLLSLNLFAFSHGFAQNADPTSTKYPATTWDDHLLIQINHWGYTNPGLDGPMSFLSNTASVPFVGFPVGIYALGIADHDRQMAISGAAIGLGEGVSGALTQLLKVITHRDRPYHVLEDVRTPNGGSGGYSFPSGHATGVWSLAAGLSLHYPDWYVIAPAALYASAVSISRAYLGVHYVTDLFGGIIMGVGCSYLVYRYEETLASWFPWFFPDPKNAGNGALQIMPQVSSDGYGLSLSFGLLPAPSRVN